MIAVSLSINSTSISSGVLGSTGTTVLPVNMPVVLPSSSSARIRADAVLSVSVASSRRRPTIHRCVSWSLSGRHPAHD